MVPLRSSVLLPFSCVAVATLGRYWGDNGATFFRLAIIVYIDLLCYINRISRHLQSQLLAIGLVAMSTIAKQSRQAGLARNLWVVRVEASLVSDCGFYLLGAKDNPGVGLGLRVGASGAALNANSIMT